MGGGRRFYETITDQKDKERQDKEYWQRRKISDDARSAVGTDLDARASFKGFDQHEFARNKRNEAFNQRSRKRDILENQEQAREAYYRRQMQEKRRKHEMRKAKEEMELGGQNPYGDSAIWNNDTKSWEANTKANNLAQWDAAKARADDTGKTNIVGQSEGTNFNPGSSTRGIINEEPKANMEDFKKLYEQLLDIQNSKK